MMAETVGAWEIDYEESPNNRCFRIDTIDDFFRRGLSGNCARVAVWRFL
jgi:hypothetical protein